MEAQSSSDDDNLPGPSGTSAREGLSGAATKIQPPEYHQIVPALRSNVEQMRKCISIDLLLASQREANFLRMIDRKAPMLYEANVIRNAIRRYESYWLPMQDKMRGEIVLDTRPNLNNIVLPQGRSSSLGDLGG